MKRYFLKHHGVWVISNVSFALGFLYTRHFEWHNLLTWLGFMLILNSKQSLFIKKYFPFIFQSFLGWGLLAISLREPTIFIVSIVIAIPYVIYYLIWGDRFLLSVITGFAFLVLPVYLISTSFLYYLLILFYFLNAVFKIRYMVTHEDELRKIGVAFFAIGVLLVITLGLSPIPFLPLLDNLYFYFKPYKVKLPTAGWTETLKSLTFVTLLFIIWKP